MNGYMKSLGSFFLLILCVWLGGCQSDEDLRTSDNTGFLVTLADELDQAYTRATPKELGKPIKEQFKLLVVDTATGKEAYSGQCSESVLVKAGLYNLTATFGDNPVIALDAPYYEGKLEGQEVKTGEMTSVEIPCSVANALLSVSFNHESLKKAFENYYVTVSVNDQAVEIDSTGGKSAYFRANSSVKLVFHGYLSGTGQEMTYDIPEEDKFQNVVARTHVKVTLGLNSEDLSSGVGISVEKLDTEIVSVTSTIPVEYMPKPKLEAEGFSNNELTFAETEKKAASVHLKLASPLQELKMRFHFEDAQFASLNDQDYLLSKDKAALENALGITLPDVNATDATIDFSNLIAKMQTNAGATTRNVIELDAQANNRWSSESMDIEEQNSQNKAFTLICNKPEFSVVVEDKNCWSREFTINEVNVTAGDAETIKKNLVYQYFDGSAWKECSTRESVKGRTQQFIQRAEEISSKVYKVRALYRGVIASAEAEATLETPEQLPNSGMEEWNTENYSKSFYCFYPWMDKGECHWDTNNLYTTRHRHNSSDWVKVNYNGFHAVSYVLGRGNIGLAAELRSTANGRGNTRAELPEWMGGVKHSEKDQNKVAGELFLGDCKVNITGNDIDGNDSYEREKSALFSNRPTALKFWYKYVPYNLDAWSVHIELLDESKKVIVQKDFTSSEAKGDWTEAIVTWNEDYNESVIYAKCKYIYVIFSSTINAGANMPYREITQTFYIDNGNNSLTFSPAYVGSVLTIDDISLVYDK